MEYDMPIVESFLKALWIPQINTEHKINNNDIEYYNIMDTKLFVVLDLMLCGWRQ